MRHFQKAFQIITAISFQQFLDVPAVFWRLSLLQKRWQIHIADRPVIDQPGVFDKFWFSKLITGTGERERRSILVEKNIMRYFLHLNHSILAIICSKALRQ